MPSSTPHGPTHHTKPSPDYRGALFHLHNAPTSRRKRAPLPNLCILLSIPFFKWLQYQLHHFQLLFVHSNCIHICIFTKACRLARPCAPHLCSLISNTQQTSAPHFLRGALFHLQIAPEPGRKRAPPRNLCILLLVSTPYRGGCDVNFTP